jgi:hypothetical protein
MALTLGSASLTGCGGSVSQTVTQVATIESFGADPAAITAGASSSLTAVFSNGTGKITPGNLSVTSGTPVSVSPAATTIYTLTVTGSNGAAVTQTVTVTVNPVIPPPAITSFTANPPAITAGGSSSLTAVFTGGTGVITPGNLSVTSGTPVSVSPAATQIYTLTVTPASGTAVTQTVTVTVNPAGSGPTINSFAANPATITAGGSSSLTAVFTGGTGVIMPGNLPATDGTPVSVSPAATQIYTLTVTPTSGTAVTQTVTVTVVPPPSITSFTANQATIGAGGSSSLTAVFTGGTGVITPGGIAATSGTAVSVSPTTTTTYTLTVTPPAGAAITQTVKVTVVPAPSITSFVAIPTTIEAGESPSLTAVFTGGTGVITPGNLPATSGTPVSVSPTTTTIYTLTVTPSVGAAITQTVTITVDPAPSITSFGASLATIPGGSSTNLTAVFKNGTGVITPGGIAVTSGKSVSVSPTATTTYTLTVTSITGQAVNQTLTVTVTGTTITSFVASPALITAGAGTNLTAVFANGTGVINPGNISVTSGVAVPVSPATSTVYTLTVTPTSGTAVTQTALVAVANAVIAVDQSSSGPPVTDQLLGMNLAAWYDVTNSTNGPAIKDAFQAAGIKAVRWPGGSWSDDYNWETNTECGNYANTDDDFTDFVNKLVIPTGLDVALTADYGTGKNCTGPGDPTEAAAWVAESLKLGVTVSHMTVGNEEFGDWETDNHPSPHDPTTYASAVTGINGYYALIKAASPNTLVGVDVDPDYGYMNWDQDVMSGAPYDFVEYHKYPETPGQESDSFLVNSGAQFITSKINAIKSDLATWGTPDTPIYVGEIGGPYSSPGKQSWSITQGLYAGQVLGEMMNDGVTRLSWWIGFGNCNGKGGNDSASLYGWQDFGAYNVFSDGTEDPTCPGAGSIGTMSPTARAFQLFSNVAVNGENVLTASVTGDTADVVAYAATHSGGTALVLFNRNETMSEPVVVTLSGQTTATSVTVITYDKAIYDLSGSPTGFFPDPAGTSTWAAPTTTTPAATLPLTLTLTPWSMNVVIIH